LKTFVLLILLGFFQGSSKIGDLQFKDNFSGTR